MQKQGSGGATPEMTQMKTLAKGVAPAESATH